MSEQLILAAAARVLHCWSTGFGSDHLRISAHSRRRFRDNRTLPSACASGSGKPAVIRILLVQLVAGKAAFDHSVVLFMIAESSGTMPRFLGIFPARMVFPPFALCREVSRLTPAACSMIHCLEGRDSCPAAGFPGLSCDLRRMTPNAGRKPESLLSIPAWLPVSIALTLSKPCTRSASRSCLSFARPSAFFDRDNRLLTAFTICNRPLFDWNSRPRLASKPVLRPVPLRRGCGSQPAVSS